MTVNSLQLARACSIMCCCICCCCCVPRDRVEIKSCEKDGEVIYEPLWFCNMELIFRESKKSKYKIERKCIGSSIQEAVFHIKSMEESETTENQGYIKKIFQLSDNLLASGTKFEVMFSEKDTNFEKFSRLCCTVILDFLYFEHQRKRR